MDKKEAQQRSVWNRIRPSNVTRQVGKINPVYRDEYAKLKAADEAIREIALGEQGFSLKELLKDLKKNNKTRRWLAVLDKAARINAMVKSIVNHDYVRDLQEGRQENIKEFYFSDTGAGNEPVDMEGIHETVNASFNDFLIKEALFGDLSRRITDQFLSNFYDKKEREVRRAMTNLASRAETLANRTLQTYKELDTARAKGQVGQYLNLLNSLKKEQQKFEEIFKNTYEAVKEYLPKQDPKEESKEEGQVSEQEAPEERGEDKSQEGDATLQQGGLDEVSFGPEGLGGEGQQPQGTQQHQQQPASNLPPIPSPPPQQQRPLPRFDMDEDEEQLEMYSSAAKKAIKEGHKGIAASILSKYSQILEDSGNTAESAKILAIAEDLLDE